MTNEEKKSNEIAAEYLAGHDRYEITYEEMREAVMTMAEWKDQQFKEEFGLIIEWFDHIAQIADDRKTLNGFVMQDSDALDEIKCLAKWSAEYVEKFLKK